MKKVLAIAFLLVATTQAHAQFGGLFGGHGPGPGGPGGGRGGQIGGIIGGVIGGINRAQRVNCNATYAVSSGGVFGRNNNTEVVQISARNAGEACSQARAGNSSRGGVFGSSSRWLQYLQCTDGLGQNFYVDVTTCQRAR